MEKQRKGNILHYLKEYGDYSFEEKGFNEVDGLLLSRFIYMNFEPFVPGPEQKGEPVELESIFFHPEREKVLDDSLYREDDKELMLCVGRTLRFGSMRLNYYVNFVNLENESQFSAMTFLLGNDTRFIGYRGTDATIVGWKEDLNLAFSKPVPGQYLAADYMDTVMELLPGNFYAGGHSKGGNLVTFAAMNCKKENRERLLHIYNYDGPGFRPEVRGLGHYDEIADRFSKYIPRSSVVGMILEDHEDYEVIESSAIGLMQHNIYSWKTENGCLIKGKDMGSGKLLMDASMNEWILSLSEEEIHSFVDTLYEVISASEALNIFELEADWKKSIRLILAAMRDVDEPTQKAIQKILHLLVKITRENAYEKAYEKIYKTVDRNRKNG